MGLAFNGTTQYVSLGAGLDIYRARPFTFAAHFDSASLNLQVLYNTLYSQGLIWYTAGVNNTTTGGWAIEIQNANPAHVEFGMKSAGTARSYQTATLAIVPNTGWYTLMMVCRTNGTGTVVDFYLYSHNTKQFTIETGAITPAVNTDPDAVDSTSSYTTNIGAGQTGTAATKEDWFQGNLAWTLILPGDLGKAGTLTPDIIEIATNGPWSFRTSAKLLMYLQELPGGVVRDYSPNGKVGTPVNTPVPVINSGFNDLPYVDNQVERLLLNLMDVAGASGVTFNLQANMRGRGGEQVTLNLDKTFTGDLDGYGKESNIPGKTYNGITGNLEGYGKEQLTPAKGFSVSGSLEGYGKESFTESKNVSFSGNLDGYGKDNFVAGKTSQVGGNLDGKAGENFVPGKSYSTSGNLDGKAGEKFTPAKSYSFLGNFLGRGGEVFTPGKGFGLGANLDGLGKLSGTVGKTLGVRLDVVGRGLLSGMPQLISGVQYLLKGDFRGRGDTQLTPTQTMETAANMRGQGQGGEKLTPTLASQLKAVFLGRGELDGRPQLISGVQKVLSASMVGVGRLVGQLTQSKQTSSNLDGRGDISAQPGKTTQAGANLRGAGDLKAIPARQGNVAANMQGKAREVFIQGKTAGLFANLEGKAGLSTIVQQTAFARAVMVGRGLLQTLLKLAGATTKNRPSAATYALDRPGAALFTIVRPTAVTFEADQPAAAVFVVEQPVGSVFELDRPIAVKDET